MSNLKKIINNMKRNQNILYGDDFTTSNFSNFYSCENVMTHDLFNLVTELYSNEYIHHNKILFNFIFLKNLLLNEKYSFTIKYLENFIIVNYFGLIENYYNIDKYSLNIKNIFYFQFIQEYNIENNIENNMINNIENNSNNNYNKSKNKGRINIDFLMIINLDDDIINLTIDMTEYLIKKNSFLFLPYKSNYKLKFNNNNKFLIVTVNYFNGYDKYDYNKHPNSDL